MTVETKTFGPVLAAAGILAGVALAVAVASPPVIGVAGGAAAIAGGLMLAFRLRAERRRADRLAVETRRLQGMLSATPQAWCGWSGAGNHMVSPALATLFDDRRVDRADDVAGALRADDAAAFVGALDRLRGEGAAFDLEVATRDGRRLRVAGRRGAAATGGDPQCVLWLEDVSRSSEVAAHDRLARQVAEDEAARLRAALDGLPVPVWLRDASMALAWCNRAYAHAVDADPATAVRDGRELSPGVGRRLAERAHAAGTAQSEWTPVVIDGNRRLMEVTEAFLPLAGAGAGAVAGHAGSGVVAGHAMDLTVLDEMRSELRRHLDAHAEVLERLGSAIAIFGADSRLTFFNQAFVDLWGLDESWLRSEPPHGELLEELRARRKLPEYADFQGFKRERLSRYTHLMEATEELMHLPDGTTLRVLASPHPMGGLIMIMEDVTNTLALESSYNTLIAVQQETLDNLAEGIAVFGGDGRLKLFNPAFARVWDLRDEDLAGEPHITSVFEHMRPFFEDGQDSGGIWETLKEEMVGATLERAVRSGRLERADGSVVEFATLPLPDGAVLNSYLDVTDSARLEQALRASNAALEAADQLKGEFIANVSHHLRTPLSGIIGFAEVLENRYFGPLTQRQEEYVKGVLAAGERMLAMIDDIVDLTSVGAGVTTLDRGVVDVADLVETVAGLTREWARREGLRLDVAADRDLGIVMGDAKRLKQALFHLVVTAIRTPPPEGRILLSARREAGSLILSVGDATLPPPGQTSLAGAGGLPGPGLGLGLVRNVIELHGGRLLIDGEPGHGNRVRCVLPAG